MRFSIIIPVYNKGPYVAKAIRSVLDQTFHDFELIVVDDGSSDDSFERAKEALVSSPISYQLIHQENAGVSTARNNGVSISTGDYLCFLDADDWWDQAFLSEMDRLIKAYPEAGIYGTNYYYVKNGRKRVNVIGAETGYMNYCQVYANSLCMPLTSISVAIPRSVFERFDGFRPHLKLGEDFDLWIKIALKYKVAFLNKPLAYYFQDSDPTWRGVGHLTDPSFHMLWNLDYLSEQEKQQPDYKRLIDALRTYSLLPYYLSKEYRDLARLELNKVDWSRQPAKTKRLYRMPVPILKFRRFCRTLGSKVKQWLIRHL